MKKLFKIVVLVMASVLVAPAFTQSAYAQTEKEIKQMKKDAEKQGKQLAKRLKKEKWTYSGAAPLEVAAERFLLATEFSGGKFRESTPTIDNAESVTRGESKARSAAENDLIREIQTAIKGEITSMTGDAGGTYTDTQVDTYVRKVARELNGDVKKHFTIYRKEANGKYTVQCFYSIPDVASSAAFKQSVQNNAEFSKMVKEMLGE